MRYGLAWSCLLAIGCAAPLPPDGPTAAELRNVTGDEGVVRFEVDGLPVDSSGDTNSNGTGELRLPEATERALRSSPDLQVALARARSAHAEARQARLLPNPVLNVAVRFATDGSGSDPVIEASLAADLVSILTIPRRASAADHRLRAASAEALTAVLDLLADVQQRFTAVQALDATILILEERRKLIDRLLEMAKSRFEMGESSRLDVLALESERLALDVERAERESERRLERLALARLIGQPSGPSDWRLPPFSVAGHVVQESDWIASALEHRPEVQAAAWELAARGDELAVAGLGVLEGSEVGADAEREEGWTVGPAISTPLPLFDWGQARRDKARFELIGARQHLTRVRRQVVQEVRQACEELNAAQVNLQRVQSQLIPVQQQRIEQAEAAYRNGMTDLTSVLVAEQQAQSSRQKLVELQHKVAASRHRLNRAVGGAGPASNGIRRESP